MKQKKIKPTYVRKDKRGVFVEIVNSGRWEHLSYGKIKKDATLGSHYHKRTKIIFFLINGKCQVFMRNIKTGEVKKFELIPNVGVIIPPLTFHIISFLSNSNFVMIKSERYDSKNPDVYHETDRR